MSESFVNVDPATLLGGWRRDGAGAADVKSIRSLISGSAGRRIAHFRVPTIDPSWRDKPVAAAFWHALHALRVPVETFEPVLLALGSDPSILSVAHKLIAAELITDVRRAQTAREIERAIRHGLGPVVLGLDWLANMQDTDGLGRLHVSGPRIGQHVVCLTGWSDSRVKGVNCWGPGWGQAGRFWITDEDLAIIMKTGEAVIPMLGEK